MIAKFVLAGALASVASMAQAQEVRVGLNLPYTGVGAELAQQIDRGMAQYLKLNPVKGYKITLVKRDVKDPSGANARTVVQELLTQDKVDVLAGWVYSPNAIASAPMPVYGRLTPILTSCACARLAADASAPARINFPIMSNPPR